ncbi:MAG: hypothetical protein D6739_08145 [Nitrospirae bacterium]|nr:MAG: hypothetical protein D6739_08145 [Nitrospirota bacterium]
MSLMLACDLAIAAEDARLHLAYGRLGLTPDGGATHHLARLVGPRRALELALLDTPLEAAAARDWGLVNRVVAAEALEAEATALAGRLAAGPTRAYVAARRLLAAAATRGLAAQLDAERESFARLTASEDFAEGVRAFLDHRPPRFTGR